MSHKQDYLSWLKNAYAMEKTIEKNLEKQISELDHQPDMKQKIKEHLEQTKQHANKVHEAIVRNGDDVSSWKASIASYMGEMEGWVMGKPQHKTVNTAVTDFATENYEIATYKSLITAAEQMKDDETAQDLKEILKQEESMAKWFDEHVSQVTEAVMQKEEKKEHAHA